MPAAYYDISIEEGSSYKLKLKFKDNSKTTVNLNKTAVVSNNVTPNVTLIPEGFEKELQFNSVGDPSDFDCNVFARMQVRNSINGSIVELTDDGSGGGPAGLFGDSHLQNGTSGIDISLADAEADASGNPTPNIKISLSSYITRRINYGNYLYDLELIFFKKLTPPATPNWVQVLAGLDPNIVSFRILQGRFTITPAISR